MNRGMLEIVIEEALCWIRGYNQTISSHKCKITFWTLTILVFNAIFHRSDYTQMHDLITELDLLPNFDWFQWSIATTVTCRQGTLNTPDTQSCSIWDLYLFYLLSQETPSMNKILHQLTTLPDLNFLQSKTFISINKGFDGTYASGVGCQRSL